MTGTQATTEARRTRVIFVYFFIFGLCGSSWLVRLPEVRSLLSLSTATLGLVLMAGAVGALISLLNSGWFISRFGARAAIGWGFAILSFAMIVTGSSAILSSVPGVVVGSVLTGVAFGLGDVGINVEGRPRRPPPGCPSMAGTEHASPRRRE